MSFKSTIRDLATHAQNDLKPDEADCRAIGEMLVRMLLSQCELQDKFDREDAAKVDGDSTNL